MDTTQEPPLFRQFDKLLANMGKSHHPQQPQVSPSSDPEQRRKPNGLCGTDGIQSTAKRLLRCTTAKCVRPAAKSDQEHVTKSDQEHVSLEQRLTYSLG
jgi:hypothetical protein